MIIMKSPEKKTVRSSESDSKQNLHSLGRLKKRAGGRRGRRRWWWWSFQKKKPIRNLEPNSRENLHSLSRLTKRRREERRRRICKPKGIVGEGGREHHWLRSSPWKQRDCHILEGVLWSFLKLWVVQQQEQAAPKPPPPPHTRQVFLHSSIAVVEGAPHWWSLQKGNSQRFPTLALLDSRQEIYEGLGDPRI